MPPTRLHAAGSTRNTAQGALLARGLRPAIMRAAVFNHATGSVTVEDNWPVPEPGQNEALIRVLRAGVCATDLEITRGYVPGYHQPLGHEFVGVVERCASQPGLVGQRVVGEINCNDAHFSCADAIFQRNHAPGRSVLGIINRGGCMAEYITLPAGNLHVVPPELTDAEACFAEPAAAACRILEQDILPQHTLQELCKNSSSLTEPAHTNAAPADASTPSESAPHGQQQQHQQQRSEGSSDGGTLRVAVVGDGRLGLLAAQVLALAAPGRVTLFGRHPGKMSLVAGLAAAVNTKDVAPPGLQQWEGSFDLVVEASGSAGGVSAALALLRPLGTLVLKTTVSVQEAEQPAWSALANDIVVNEKKLVGSRCGPMDAALRMLCCHAPLRALVNSMLQHEVPLQDALRALDLAAGKGVLKVQLVC